MTTGLPIVVEGGRMSVSNAYAVETRSLSKRYGDVEALADVDLRVPVGAVYLLAGTNGAGKTTLMEVLLDLTAASSGLAFVFGIDTSASGAVARAQVGYVSARQSWGYQWMSVAHLLAHHAAFFPSWDDAYAARLANVFGLPLHRKLGGLSKGFARRVHLVTALAHRPPLLLLDEPTEGLDRVVRDELMAILAEHLAESPTTVVISTHQIHEIDPFVDHVGVLRNGRLFAQVDRARLHDRLRRWSLEVPSAWDVPAAVSDGVLQRAGSAREVDLMLWGDKKEVATSLVGSGASVREEAPLSLDDAVLALLRAPASARLR